jgi:hypothetical protein
MLEEARLGALSPRSPLIPLGLVGLVAAAITAGCGGGSSGPLTLEELVAKSNEICRDQTQRFAEIQAKPPGNAPDAVAQTNALIDVSRDELSAFEDLEPPPDLRADLDRYLDARRTAIDQLEAGHDAAQRQDRSAYGAAVTRALKQTPERRRLADALGFTDCN